MKIQRPSGDRADYPRFRHSFAFLRNIWYVENYIDQLSSTLEHGAAFGGVGDGRISAVTRADYAAAVVVLTSKHQENNVYELGGDTEFTLSEQAAEISKQTGGDIVYRDLPI